MRLKNNNRFAAFMAITVSGQAIALACHFTPTTPLSSALLSFGLVVSFLGALCMLVLYKREGLRRDHLEAELGTKSAEQAELAKKLAVYTAAVETSNRDLQEFAHVASHDLQEPLRMVSSYLQLIASRYQGKLDKDADEFIGYAVDGAKRMQQLIQDLLAYARLNRETESHSTVETGLIVKRACDEIRMLIEESGAVVQTGRLPSIPVNPFMLQQVFQNLIANAIKFRRDEPAVISINAVEEDGQWKFSVKDNGIGILPEFAERVFGVFQRLHNRSTYPGSGIGLAICRRAIEIHHGKIWLEANSDVGTTFFFTIPK